MSTSALSQKLPTSSIGLVYVTGFRRLEYSCPRCFPSSRTLLHLPQSGNTPNTEIKTADHIYAHWGCTGWDRKISSLWLQRCNQEGVSRVSNPIYGKLTFEILSEAFAESVAICDLVHSSQIMIERLLRHKLHTIKFIHLMCTTQLSVN